MWQWVQTQVKKNSSELQMIKTLIILAGLYSYVLWFKLFIVFLV